MFITPKAYTLDEQFLQETSGINLRTDHENILKDSLRHIKKIESELAKIIAESKSLNNDKSNDDRSVLEELYEDDARAKKASIFAGVDMSNSILSVIQKPNLPSLGKIKNKLNKLSDKIHGVSSTENAEVDPLTLIYNQMLESLEKHQVSIKSENCILGLRPIYLTKTNVVKTRQIATIIEKGNFLKEVLLWQMMDDSELFPLIVQIHYATVESKLYAFILLSFMSGKSLSSRSDEMMQANEFFTIKEVKFIMRSLVSALEYFHSRDIIFNDFAEENIMLCNDQTIKLFHLKSAHPINLFHPIELGNPAYTSPDVARGRGHHFSDDIWALGILLYILTFQKHPLYTNQTVKEYLTLLKKSRDIKVSDILKPDARDFICRLLRSNREQRLGFQNIGEIRAHAYFNGEDWTVKKMKLI